MTNTPDHQQFGPGQPRPFNQTKNLVPLTVWMCSDVSNRAIAQGGASRIQMCARHQIAPGRELARHLVATCTQPGDVVAEAYPSSDAVLVSAWKAGRLAIGCVPHLPLAQHIGGLVRRIIPPEELGAVGLRACRPDQMHRGLADQIGRVGLVIAEPPPWAEGGQALSKERPACPACRADIWQLTSHRLRLMFASAWKVLRPGGVLAVITTARHTPDGRLEDPASQIIRDATALGFTYAQHVIALRVPLDGDTLAVQTSPEDYAQLRTRHAGMPQALTVHADVCLLVKPDTAGPARKGNP